MKKGRAIPFASRPSSHVIEGGKHKGKRIRQLSVHELAALRDGRGGNVTPRDREAASIYISVGDQQPVSVPAFKSKEPRKRPRKARRSKPIYAAGRGRLWQITFGKYKGRKLKDLPIRYINDLCYAPSKISGPREEVWEAAHHAYLWLCLHV